MARPSKYSAAIADSICSRIAGGESVRFICESDGMPNRETIRRWIERHEDFSAKCARAWELQADALADQQLEVAADVLKGKIDPQAGKVAVSVYQWLGSKRAPKKYGDRSEVNVTGQIDVSMSIVDTLRRRREQLAKIEEAPKALTSGEE